MEQSQRITPEELIEAYKSTSLIPVRAEFVGLDKSGRRCACGIAALAIYRGSQDFVGFMELTAIDRLGLDDRYAYGFTQGFDGVGKPYGLESSEKTKGFEDGTACRQAIWNKSGECLI